MCYFWYNTVLSASYNAVTSKDITLQSRRGVAQWVARLTRNVEVVGSTHIKGPGCFLEQETLPLLLSTDWYQERI